MIGGFLGKMVLGFVVVAVVLYDGGSIAINFFTLDSTADEIAVALSTEITPGTGAPNPQTLQLAAKQKATESGARLVSVSFDTATRVIHLTIRRRASTLVVGRIGPLEDWTKATAEGQAGSI